MSFSIVGVIVAGLVGTIAISMVMKIGPKMGMPEMNIVYLLGAMFGGESNFALGMAIHLMMGVAFTVIYALLWAVVGYSILLGVVFGIGHWIITGAMMGAMPMMHAGIKSGNIQAPGMYMINNGGVKSFMGGMMGHIVFGLVVALVYGLFL